MEFDGYDFSLTENITPSEIHDWMAAIINESGGPRKITHAAVGEVGKPWTREWGQK